VIVAKLRLNKRFAQFANEDWETTTYAGAADRYAIAVTGGSSNLSVIR
jgi:hypothetical protein